jgi:radical SAM superfamily enzyme YgiQ (UPF0313 family)
MSKREKPTILLLYPSSFYYPSDQERHEIKSSMLLLGSYLIQFFPVVYADFEITIGRPSGNVQIKRFQRRAREFLEKEKFDILAISCWTSLAYKATMSAARIARELYPDCLIVVGGYHPSAVPQDFCVDDNIIDYVIAGEGELALKELAEAFPISGRPSETKIIAGKSVLPENYVTMNWDLTKSFIAANFPSGLNSVAIYLSRGCPFDCSFCMESLKERRWHPYPAKMAAEAVDSTARELNLRAVNLGDACFGLKAEWRREFLTALSEKNPPYWITFETRPEFFNKEDAAALAKLNVAVELGVESFSPKMLRLMNKTPNPKKFLEAFRRTDQLLSEHGVIHMANLIFNHPGETEETLQETFAFMDSLIGGRDSFLTWACHEYMHYPGSLLDREKARFEREFGTQILAPEWWKLDEDQLLNCRRVIPSRQLGPDKLGLWKAMYKERSEQIKSSLDDRAFIFAAETYSPSWRNDPRYRESPR